MNKPSLGQRIRWTIAGLVALAVGGFLLTQTEQPPWVGLSVLGIGIWLVARTPTRELFEMVKSYLPWGPKQ